jgi:hypothetical protein
MEDYWQNKLVDERKFYEEQLKTNENQFKELENRMKEYDEVLNTLNINKQDENDKLSTIDETRSLEYQVWWSFLLKYSKLFVSGGGMGRRNSST